MMIALMMCLMSYGQSVTQFPDTIFTKEGALILCKINSVIDNYIYYTKIIDEGNGVNDSYQNCGISFFYVSKYTKDYSAVVVQGDESVSYIKRDTNMTYQKILDLNKRLLYAEQETKKINLRLGEFHQEYKTGTSFMVGGLIMTGIGTVWMVNNNARHTRHIWMVNNNVRLTHVCLGIGGICLTVGGIIQIDSHRHLP